MKLFLGILLLLIGLIGLYSTTSLSQISTNDINDAFQIILIEARRNRIITSAFAMIAGLVMIIDHKNKGNL